jgi:hypothetical protein
VAYTGSRHRRSVPKKSQIPAGQYGPDVNPSSVGVAADVSFSPSTGVDVSAATEVTATVKRAAASVRKVEVGGVAATNLVVLSDTQFKFKVATSTPVGTEDVIIYDGVSSVTKTGGLVTVA